MQNYHYRLTDPTTKHWLADVFITKDGVLSALTDYEPLGYRWNSIGDRTILQFILDCDNEYLTGKTLEYDHHIFYSVDKTVMNIKNEIINQRKLEYITGVAARIEWNLATHLKHGEITFDQFCEDSVLYSDHHGFAELYATELTNCYKVTRDIIFPELKKMIIKKARIDKNHAHG